MLSINYVSVQPVLPEPNAQKRTSSERRSNIYNGRPPTMTGTEQRRAIDEPPHQMASLAVWALGCFWCLALEAIGHFQLVDDQVVLTGTKC